MPRVCPKCHRESPVESDFCPACGAPMNEHVMQGQARAAARAMDDPPMKWHRFLMFFSLPLSIIMNAVGLFNAAQSLRAFDPSLYVPEYLGTVRLSMYLDIVTSAILVLLAAGAEYGLIKMKWTGVRLVLAMYILQEISSAVLLYLLVRIHGEIAAMLPVIITGAAMIAITWVYYSKRRKLFS